MEKRIHFPKRTKSDFVMVNSDALYLVSALSVSQLSETSGEDERKGDRPRLLLGDSGLGGDRPRIVH